MVISEYLCIIIDILINGNQEMLKGDKYFSPFLGDKKPLSIGLNPLGIRTASEQLFTTLLPGMNVVTLRIRYYSFYCWLLKNFYKGRTEAKRADLQRHIRMSELLMALVHAQSDYSSGVPGITRASEIVANSEELIDFNEDAMPKGKPVGGYWKGAFGAFGTYYAVSLQEMGIIAPLEDNSGLYNITPKCGDYISGEELADAFQQSVGHDMGNMFFNSILTGIVTRKQLAQLEPAFQSHNIPDNNECRLLLYLLLQKDRPSSLTESNLRKESLRLLLSYMKVCPLNDFSELEFARYVYDNYNNGKERSVAAVGWYAYYLNDSRQYEYLNIFDVLLERLQESNKPGQWENIDEFTSSLAKELCGNLCATNHTVGELLERWDSVEEPKEKMAHAFYVILDNYKKNPKYKECKSVIRSCFRSVSNDALDAFDDTERNLNCSVFHFLKKFLTEDIIYNHFSESMRKFSQNGIPTQKLTIENGYVRGIATYKATHSSPRIETLRNFITDLGLVDNYQVTEKGGKLLRQLQND